MAFKKHHIVFGFLLLVGKVCAQQQGLQSNFLLHQYVYNPAAIGVVQGQQYNIGFRNQWTGFEGAPRTAIASGYGTLKKRTNMTLGGMVTSERIGLIDFTSFYGLYSYRLKINKSTGINFGIGAGAVQFSVKSYNARPYDRDDPYLNGGLLNAFAFDASAGFYFYSKNFFLGFSNQHMANSKIRWHNSIGSLSPHFYSYAGYSFKFGETESIVIQPSILFRNNSPTPYQLDYNLRAIYKENIWLGLNYRDNATAGISAGFMIKEQFSISYGYDFTISDISTYVSGTHDILISYYISMKKRKSKSELIQEEDEVELNRIDNSIKTNIKLKSGEEQAPKEETDSDKKEIKQKNTEIKDEN